MDAEFLAKWIESAEVEEYKKDNKQVFVAFKGNERLILTCERVQYSHGLHPHVTIVWIKDGESELVYQDIVGPGNQIIYSTGNLTGSNGVRENTETIWAKLCRVMNVQ